VKTPSAQIFSAAHFRRYMQRQWEEKKFKFEMEGRVGVRVSELIKISRRRNSKVKTPYLELWISVLDEFLSWQISLITVFYALRRRTKGRWSNFDRSIILILMKIISDSIAMRHLILLGYDAAAKALLRSIGEYMELLVAILDDPKLANDFVRSSTPERANRFWKKHVAWGGLQNKMQRAWETWFQAREPAAAAWFANWGRSSNTKLSAFIHPSFAGGLFATIPFKTKQTNENWLGLWGDKSDGSVDTIYVYASFMFPLLLLHDGFPFTGFDKFLGRPIKFQKKIELHRHVKEGRFILASLILSLGKRSNHKYVFPTYDLSIFKSSRRKRGPVKLSII
jgi:hypothetical protein